MIGGATEPTAMRPGWLPFRRGILPVLVALVVVALVAGLLPRLGGHLGPTASGLLTLAAMLAAGTYGLRRRFPLLSLFMLRPFAVVPPLRSLQATAVRFDQLRVWRIVHLVIGTLCVLPFWWHVNSARGGLLEQMLFWAVLLVLGSGVLGACMQVALPNAMLRRPEREVRVRDARDKVRALYVDAEERILGKSEPLVQAYLQKVRPLLQGDTPRWSLLMATLRGSDPATALARPTTGSEGLEEGDAEVFHGLAELAEHKARLDLNLFQLRLSGGWLAFHDLAVACGAGLVVLHVTSVLYFGGP